MSLKNISGLLILIFLLSLFINCSTSPTKHQEDPVPVESNFRLVIESTHDQIQGHYTDVDLTIFSDSQLVDGFDILIAYDGNALTFIEATLDTIFINAGWEFFTYRYGYHGDCGVGCPPSNIRLFGMAETNNGAFHPEWDEIREALRAGTKLATITFFVSSDVNFGGASLPLKFFWQDCGDNTFSTEHGDYIALAHFVFPDHADINDSTQAFTDPTFPGIASVPENCDSAFNGLASFQGITLQHGYINIVEPHDIDSQGGIGDINDNNIPHEIADAVLFSYYFISGISAFGSHVEASTIASDVNLDGVTLGVADFVYLVRIIVGDALPHTQLEIPGAQINITAKSINGQLVVSYDSNVEVGAILLVFEGGSDVSEPVLGDGASDMDVVYGVNNDQFRVLIYNIGTNSLTSGQHPLVSIPYDTPPELIEVEASNYQGGPITAAYQNQSSIAVLTQNYSNPFSDRTSISILLSNQSSWSLEIVTSEGRFVRSFEGISEAGEVIIEWDGTHANGRPMPNGIYFYRATIGDLVLTKYMMLLRE